MIMMRARLHFARREMPDISVINKFQHAMRR